jgi:hypothetical protein
VCVRVCVRVYTCMRVYTRAYVRIRVCGSYLCLGSNKIFWDPKKYNKKLEISGNFSKLTRFWTVQNPNFDRNSDKFRIASGKFTLETPLKTAWKGSFGAHFLKMLKKRYAHSLTRLYRMLVLATHFGKSAKHLIFSPICVRSSPKKKCTFWKSIILIKIKKNQ